MHHKLRKPGTLAELSVSGRPVFIECGQCHHYRRLNMAALSDRVSRQATCDEILSRHRCTNCGAKRSVLRYSVDPNSQKDVSLKKRRSTL